MRLCTHPGSHNMWRSCSLRRGVGIAVYLLICMDLVTSGPPVDIIEKVAGSSVTLLPKFSGSPAGISWWLNGHILVDIQLKPQKQDYSYPAFSLFKNKADIDHSRGRLTIRDLTEAESGYYRAEVVVGEKILVTHMRLIVLPQAREVLEAEAGSSITLQPRYSGDLSEISWWKATDVLADLQLKPSGHVGYYHFKGRAAINNTTGQLTISNLTKADSGLYRAEVVVNNRTQYMGVKLTVLAQPPVIQKVIGSSITLEPTYSGDPTEISWWMDEVPIVNIKLKPLARVNFSRLKDRDDIDRSTGHLTLRNLTEAESAYYRAEVLVDTEKEVTSVRLIVFYQLKDVTGSVGGSVTLVPEYSGDPMKISWWSEAVEVQPKPPSTAGHDRLQDRAAIDPSTGLLTIRDLKKEDSGLYRSEELVNDRTRYAGTRLTVIDSGGRGGPDRRLTGSIIGAGVILAALILILYYCQGKSGPADRAEPGEVGQANGEADGVSDKTGGCKHFLDNVVLPQHPEKAGSTAPAVEDETDVERTGKLDEITAL